MPEPLARRAFLGAAIAACAAAWLPGDAHAEPAKPRIRSVERGPLGATIHLDPRAAPFPFEGAPYTDSTVVVFVPVHFRATKSIDVLLHFHGHNTTVDRALVAHELREQLSDSKQNAILVVPQGPLLAAESSFGKLQQKNGLRALLAEVLALVSDKQVRTKLGAAAIPRGARVGMLCVSAHSGGYYPTAAVLQRGGVNVDEVYLFDALYGEVPAFRDWVAARKGRGGRARHKLISQFVGGRVLHLNFELKRSLEALGVACLHETVPGTLTRGELTAGRAIFLQTPLSHGGVTHEQNNLRDCLFASGLRRQLASDWFEAKDDPRAIDARR